MSARAEICAQACAGIDDPIAAIAAAREALAQIGHGQGVGMRDDTSPDCPVGVITAGELRRLRVALALLGAEPAKDAAP